MIKRRHGTSLNRTRGASGEDVNPSAYITNIADCMLVLALGLLVALIARFDLQLDQQPEEQIIGIEVNMDADNDGVIDEGYEQKGEVYYDSATGKYYMVQD
ncbi:MAG: hypothetical protein K6G78_06925 [bacterium]|nr:hypothetical protein [bacterium]